MLRQLCIGILVLCPGSVCAAAAMDSSEPRGAPRDTAVLFAEMNALKSPDYTGGLSRKHRALAEEIRWAMRARFPAKPCPPLDGDGGTLIGFMREDEKGLPSTEGMDPDLVALLKAFNHERQEVRDTATYTIGLLGPSAADAVPFLKARFGLNFSEDRPKGNWHNDAYARLTCERVAEPDFRQVIPDRLLPPEKPWNEFLAKAAILMAELYLDEDIEYPPGMMGGAYGNFAIADQAGPAAPLFAKILENENLSTQKHIEAARALKFLKPEITRTALPAVLRHSDTASEVLRYYVVEILIKLKHPKAIRHLIGRLRYDAWQSEWKRELCNFGPEALRAENALLGLIADDRTWPFVARQAVETLGCLKSRRAVPVLIELLDFPDWETRRDIATALGKIGDRRRAVRRALAHLADRHWSKQVRNAAAEALVRLGLRKPPAATAKAEPPNDEDSDTIVTHTGPYPVDHGLPWCDDGGRYSIDGSSWFRVQWHDQKLMEVPEGFPLSEDNLPDFGSSHFLRVADGWLYGADLGHYDGFFLHIADAGKITELDEPRHTDIVGYVRRGGKILAFGYQVLKGGDGGSLFEVFRRKDGTWTSRRIAALPGPPDGHGEGPNGELLLRDGANSYAFISGKIVPLKCEKVKKGSFFDRE